jgi:hypothetical protein
MLSIGANVITAVATDNEGLTASDTITVYYFLEPETNLPPTITIQNPNDGATSSTALVTISGIASDDNSIAEVRVEGMLASGLDNWTRNYTLALGTNIITAIVTDNEGLTGSDTITVYYNPETPETNIPPVIIIQNPANGATSATALVTISGIASDDIDLTEVTINGMLVSGLNNWNLDYTLTLGANVITAIATDNEGLTGTDTITVYYDSTIPDPNIPPTITILNPNNGVTSSTARVTISGDANDDVNVTEVRVNGQLASGINNWLVDIMLLEGANII